MSADAVVEPFAAFTESRVVEASARRAVIEQGAEPVLDNHVGVRHASALHAAGYAASRALLVAALHGAGPCKLSLIESEIEYVAVGLGPLTTVAEPVGDGWDGAVGALGAAEPLSLTVSVTTTNEGGKPVARLKLTWSASPDEASTTS